MCKPDASSSSLSAPRSSLASREIGGTIALASCFISSCHNLRYRATSSRASCFIFALSQAILTSSAADGKPGASSSANRGGRAVVVECSLTSTPAAVASWSTSACNSVTAFDSVSGSVSSRCCAKPSLSMPSTPDWERWNSLSRPPERWGLRSMKSSVYVGSPVKLISLMTLLMSAHERLGCEHQSIAIRNNARSFFGAPRAVLA